ncbi:hypothetical protein [Dyadobacter sp. CY343]|nr:hypothetical protein [Dyadobacter sp. CY343]MCE7061965.1 hypothetical protein [Dyadobacter sp. CY343]
MVRQDRFETSGQAGVFDFFETVYRKEDESVYEADMGEAYHMELGS